MKTLYIVRHAKSGWENGVRNDFDRTLSARGLRTAPVMANVLKEKKILPDLIISSPATRALTTAKLFSVILGYPEKRIEERMELYDAHAGTIFETLRQISDECSTVMIFGHNPSLLEFASLFGGKKIDVLVPCGVIRIDLDISSWKKSTCQAGKNIWYEMPEKYTYPQLNPAQPSDPGS
ncbi:MAG: phosphohistidine phosphatase [Chlorobiaceae bacterium]|nr:phosphohistidine phosphatase [Chlorobiaceae bacterium]NTV60730.1 phosphohistidine phosphatase [Chlorobiaceae bacterium]